MSDEFISVSEAAQRLRVSDRRIRQLIEEKELAARRIGNSWVIPLAEIFQRQRRSPRPGRPYEPENAWRLAAFADIAAREFLNSSQKDASDGLLEKQQRAVSQLAESLQFLCEVDPHQVVDNPANLADLRRLVSRVQFGLRSDELLVGWMQIAADRLRYFETKAQIDSLSVSQAWLDAFAREPVDLELDPRLLRNLRNMLMHGLGRPGRGGDIAALRSRFERADYFYAHPSLMHGLVKDHHLSLSGGHAAAQYGLDLVPGDNLDAYVAIESLNLVVDSYSLQEVDSFNGNVVLRSVQDFPDNHPDVVPRLFLAIDLIEGDDPRGREAGSELLEALSASLSLSQQIGRWKYGFQR